MINPNASSQNVTVAHAETLVVSSSHLIFHSSHAWLTCALFILPADSRASRGFKLAELLCVSQTHQSTKANRKHPTTRWKKKKKICRSMTTGDKTNESSHLCCACVYCKWWAFCCIHWQASVWVMRKKVTTCWSWSDVGQHECDNHVLMMYQCTSMKKSVLEAKRQLCKHSSQSHITISDLAHQPMRFMKGCN